MHVFDLEAGLAHPDYNSFTTEYWNRRDVFLASNLVARSDAHHHAALWAHDDHVLSVLDSGAAAQGQVTTGTELRRLIGNDYVSIGFAWSTGSFNARLIADGAGAESARDDLEPRTLTNDLPGDLGNVLEQVGPERFWIDLRHYPANLETWGKTFYFRGWAGFGINQKFWDARSGNRTTLLPSHDILVYFKTITPSHLWPVPSPTTVQ